ncbi:hypothetical protein SDC9_112069 [bioreactor metagenome]|uniref:Uncharacterized protein n=1 Tax=bioreactor metagenome TaxID=1076179 RepID=A0A645BIH7_9ZZZZ
MHSDGENAKVGSAVIRCLRSGMSSDPKHLSYLVVGILAELAEQSHRTIFEIGEGGIGGNGGVKTVELLLGLVAEVQRCS